MRVFLFMKKLIGVIPLFYWTHTCDTMDLQTMNRFELLMRCKEMGRKHYSALNKTQLIQLLDKPIVPMADNIPVSVPIIAPFVCPPDVMDGKSITKEIRQQCFGHIAGGAGSRGPEDFQRNKIQEGTQYPCVKTNTRIHLRTFQLTDIAHPNTFPNGFEYSEDFDGVQCIQGNTIYINLKCIVGKGGAQTRSLREVYWLVEGQLHALKNLSNVYFANILDGDEAHHSFTKFDYLLNLPEFQATKQYVYVGDLRGYFQWIYDIIFQQQQQQQQQQLQAPTTPEQDASADTP